MSEGRSTGRSRQLGAELRKRREATKRTRQEVARELGWSASKVSRLESGNRGQSEVDVAIYLTFCGVLRDELDELLAPTREADAGYRLQQHGEQLPDELHSLVFYETTATMIDNFELNRLPGLTQTEDYARALLRQSVSFPADGLEPRVQARMDRQSLIKRLNPPQFSFIVHEQALRLQVGDIRVMHEQMLQLLFLGNRPQCEIRVVPTNIGGHAGLGGPFMLMRYTDAKPVVYVENETTSLFLEDRAHIDVHQAILARLAEVALDEGQSRELIASLANEYDRPE